MKISGKKILFARICGTGVSSLALICKSQGAEVIGVDLAYYPPVSTKLEEENVRCYGMDRFYDLINSERPDIIVVGNALNGKSKEAEFIIECGIPYYSMPSFIEEFLLPSKRSVVLSGTHGKTTSTTMFSEVLTVLGKDPSYVIGGIPDFSGTNAHFTPGSGYFVIEGDEYDTAFFDKGPKFLHYKPDVAIITSIEFDHADIYDSIDKIFSNFKQLTEITTDKVILCKDFEHNRLLAEMISQDKLFTYSVEDQTADAFACQTGRNGNMMIFSVKFRDGGQFKFTTPFFGKQNLMNLCALISFLKLEGFDLDSDAVKDALAGMKGIKRRQELLGKINGGLIYSDFAHHPTAVDLTFQSFRDFFPEKKIFVIFDPATNSNNQNIFEEQYRNIFQKTDKVVIGHPPKLDKFPPELRFSPERVVSGINESAGTEKAFYYENIEDTIDWLKRNSSDDTVTVVMSNSGFYDFFTKIKPIVE